MKILKIVQGFTTNSSGAYEWLPPEAYSNINSSQQKTVTPTSSPSLSTSSQTKPTSSKKSVNSALPRDNLNTQQQKITSEQTRKQDNLDQYQFVSQTSGGLTLFFVSLASGVIALTLILLKLFKNIRSNSKGLKETKKIKE